MTKILITGALAVLSGLTAAGQTAPSAFEVASVKVIGRGAGPDWSTDPGQFRFTGPLKFILIRAYGAKNYQISGPAWLWSDYYEIVAKLPEGAQEDQIPSMLRSLLVERFRMTVHWENRQQRAYALVVGKTGPHLQESKEIGDRIHGMSFTTKGHLEFKGTSLTGFAETMSSLLDRPVIDMTGLQGHFDILLNVSMEDLSGLKKLVSDSDAAAAVQQSDAPASIFTAIQELGLKFESRSAPVKYLVVDDAQKVPTGN